MKKAIICLIMLLGAATGAFAQVIGATDTVAYWGMRVSLDVDIPGKWETKALGKVSMLKPGAGVSVGAVYHLPLAASFYLEPGASLYYDTFKDRGLTLSDTPENIIYPTYGRFGIRVPVMIGSNLIRFDKCDLSIFLGPELNYAMAGHIAYNSAELDDSDIGHNMFKDNIFRRFDVACRVGVAVNLDTWHMSISYAKGLTSFTKNDIKCHDNRLAITLGYNF